MSTRACGLQHHNRRVHDYRICAGCRSASIEDGLPTYRDWIEVFRKSIPTFKSHALTDKTVPEDQREVGQT